VGSFHSLNSILGKAEVDAVIRLLKQSLRLSAFCSDPPLAIFSYETLMSEENCPIASVHRSLRRYRATHLSQRETGAEDDRL
jgi:hypothetical protein